MSRFGYMLMAVLVMVLMPLAILAAGGSALYSRSKESSMRSFRASMCSADSDCPPGFICIGSRCVPQS